MPGNVHKYANGVTRSTPRLRRNALNKDLIIDAAMRVVDADGLGALTIRRVADELGASPMGLYGHVRTRDEILDGLIERAVRLPHLPQAEFDRLLWSSDLLFVRGEDSLVRAIWAGAPFVWQLYPQDDVARAAKLHAFVDLFLDGTGPDLAPLQRLFSIWNGLAPAGEFAAALAAIDMATWQQHCLAFRERMASQPELCASLIDFAAGKR